MLREEWMKPAEVEEAGLQSFEGWWDVADSRLLALGIKESQVAPLGGAVRDMRVFGTILATVFLEKKLPSKRDAWELVIEKAKGWLAGAADIDTVQRLTTEVEKMLAE